VRAIVPKAVLLPAILLGLVGCSGATIDVGRNEAGGGGEGSSRTDGASSDATEDEGFSGDASVKCPAESCALCSDGNWHCDGKIYPPCGPGYTPKSCQNSCPKTRCIFCNQGDVTLAGCSSSGECGLGVLVFSCSP
jgi:hypothetical protein